MPNGHIVNRWACMQSQLGRRKWRLVKLKNFFARIILVIKSQLEMPHLGQTCKTPLKFIEPIWKHFWLLSHFETHWQNKYAYNSGNTFVDISINSDLKNWNTCFPFAITAPIAQQAFRWASRAWWHKSIGIFHVGGNGGREEERRESTRILWAKLVGGWREEYS